MSSSLALCISHPLPIPRGPPCLRARVDVYECRGGKRSVISPRGALNLPAARFLQTKRFDPLDEDFELRILNLIYAKRAVARPANGLIRYPRLRSG